MEKPTSLTFFILPKQKAALKKLAELDGECISVTLRRLITAAAKENGVWSAQFDSKSTNGGQRKTDK